MKNTRAILHEVKSSVAAASQEGVSKGHSEGDEWGFGQLLPVILLLLPLCSIAQNYFGTHDHSFICELLLLSSSCLP